MDKGKSKTDLRAVGKKRLEEYRQKRQQKGSSTKPSSTTALKALTESEQSVGENAVEEFSRRVSPLKVQRSSSQKDGEAESVVNQVHGDALEERHEVDVVCDTSPGSSVTSSVQRLKVGGDHLTPETSEQSVESLREPGSSNGNLDDEDREAVYTILWENHGTDDSQRNEEWQESIFDGGASLNERRLHQGNCSSFWVDNESYRGESKEGLSTQRKLSGNSMGTADKFQSSEEWDKPSLSLVLSEQRPMHDAEAEESRKHVLPVYLGFIGHSSFSNEESFEERMLLKWNEELEKENADMFALDLEVNPTLSNLSSEPELGEKLQSVQGMLQARDMELIDAIAKLEGATRVISEQEEEAKAYVQQNERLKEELMKCCEDLGMLKSNVNMAEQKMIGLRNELHEIIDSSNSIPEERNSQTEGLTLSMNEMVTEVNSLAKAIVEQAQKREMELQSANETAMAALLLESNTRKTLLTKFDREFQDSKNAAQDISWLYGASPPQSSLLDWATWLIDTLQNEHRKFEQHFQVTESMTLAANANTLKLQQLQETIDSLNVELSNQRIETETVAEDLRSRDLELQRVRNKLQEQVENNRVLESEIESARSKCRVESALLGIEDIVGDFRFQGRPPATSTPSEWISWLVQIFREVSEESNVLSVQVEEAKHNYSSLHEELLSLKNENEILQSKQKAVHEMFGAERDSLKAEMQVLRDSSVEFSRRENEFSETLKSVTSLQEALTSKDRELSELHAEIDDLSLRSAEQDSKIQSLMKERETLSSEEVKAQRLLQETIDSLNVELSNQQIERAAVAEDLRSRDLELQRVRNKLQEQVENNRVLESEVESARSKCRVESALLGIEDIVGDFRFQGRPPATSTPSEWISWLVQIFREVSEESNVLSVQVEEAKHNYSSLHEELLSLKNENEILQSKQKAVHEMFGAERDSLKAEMQVLRDSSVEFSRRENEFSETLKSVTSLQEALTSKDRELSELHAEIDDLSLRSAEQDSKIQSLMKERETLSSEEVKAQRLLQETIDSLNVELSNQRIETETVAEDLRSRDLELQRVRNKLQEQVENKRVLESEVESARSKCRVESALLGIEDIVGDFRFQGRPPATSTPSEWISWLVQIFREVSEESNVLSVQVEEAKHNYSSLHEELLSLKNENEILQSKQKAVHEMFGAERDSLKAEMQVLRDSFVEFSRRESESSETLKSVTSLQEALTSKDRELSELHAEIDDLSLRSAEQDSKIQSLMKERETLSSEEVKAQRLLQETIDSLNVELSNQRIETETVAEDLRSRDLELQRVRNKLQEQVENNRVLESEVESARSKCRVESALLGIEDIVGDFRFQGRPPATSTPSEWISWLVQIFREVSEESNVLSVQVEEAKHNYSSLHEELLSLKNENEILQSKQKAVHEMFGAERDSLKAEMQVLRDSSVEFSRRENEFSETLKSVTSLQEALISKDRELSELHAEIDDLSLRSAEQDSKIQSLMGERERLSSEVVAVKAECNLLQVELAQTADEKNNLQSDVNQLEQKLGAVREKLNLAISKGKGLVKQRDSLKMSLAEETAKVETMVSAHANDSQSKDSKLLEMRAQVESMGTRVEELQTEVSSLFEKAAAYEQRLEAERRGLESVFFGIEISNDLQPRDPIDKVKWLVSVLEGTRSTTKFLEEELRSSRNGLETLKAELRDTEERLQSVTVESLRAQDDISMYVKKVEEFESRATFDRTQYKIEVDDLTRALKEADLRQQAAWSRVKEFEKTVEKQQNNINASEVAHSKAVTKLTFTRNKLNLLVQDSQELVRECESLHKSLQERDIEIAELNHEVDKLKNVIHIEQSQRMDASSKTSSQLTLLQEELARTNEKCAATVKELRERVVELQRLLKEKDSGLEGVRTKIEDILLKGDDVLWMEHNVVHRSKGDDGVPDVDVQSMNGSLDFTSALNTLEVRFNNLVAEAQLHRNSSDKKEAQIQKLKKELYDISIERTTLQAGVQAKTMEVERLQSEVNSKGVPVECNISAESEIEELGTRSTWSGTGNPVTPHVRGPRRHSQADIAIDMVDANNSNLLSDMNDKEHGFSALTNSRLVPKAARILADRLDGLWFVGGRILTRQPSARLGLAMYWIFVHIYMAMIVSRGIL